MLDDTNQEKRLMNELRIGICDDEVEYQKILHNICEEYFDRSEMKHLYTFFNNGEEVIKFCEDKSKQIDLLFLDVEMCGIDGITLKDILLQSDNIQKIVFVTSHKEAVYDAFSKKTMGFIEKPILKERVFKVLSSSIDEINSNIKLEFTDSNGDYVLVELENIIYFKADGSYTYMYINKSNGADREYHIISKKLGEIEKMLEGTPIIRVHKSYMINLEYIRKITDMIEINNINEKIPIGRAYSKIVKKRYYCYTKRRILNRI